MSPSYYFTILRMTTVTQEQLYSHMKCLELLSKTFPEFSLSEHSSKSCAPRFQGTPTTRHCASVPSSHHTFALPETYKTKHDAQASRGLLPHGHAAVTLASQLGISPICPTNLNLVRKRGANGLDRLSVISTF